MYRVYYITVICEDEKIYESAGLTEKTLHKLITDFCNEESFPYWKLEITSKDYDEKPWWLNEE